MCKCKVCGLNKVRQEGGKRSGCRGAYKVDGAGRRWNGLTCPDCKGSNLGIRRDEPQASFGPAEPLYQPKLRSCQDCGGKTPNYYRCVPCNTQHMTNNSSAYYGGFDEITISTEMRYRHSKAGFHY